MHQYVISYWRQLLPVLTGIWRNTDLIKISASVSVSISYSTGVLIIFAQAWN
jgi:hypothetical protein